MKVIIEGEPEEIAALEQALKGGKRANYSVQSTNDFLKIRKEAFNRISPLVK